jgi:protein-ribulosamine 3-kinase
MLSAHLIKSVENLLAGKMQATVKIESVRPVGGGSINDAFELTTGSGNFFLKVNHGGRFPGMFEAEAKGLQLLRETNTIGIPDVIGTGEVDGIIFLLMGMIVSAKRRSDFWESFGRSFAALHRITTEQFGLDHNNYIGSLPQSNRQNLSGSRFMIEERFHPLVKLAKQKNLLSEKDIDAFDRFYLNLNHLLPEETPSLLHGDLWNGNYLTGNDGNAWLIDPAVYYGYRETDLAIARLFGGFDEKFFSAYNESFPLPDNWQSRIELFQLYPLLVHLILFGRSYYEGVRRVVLKYS